MKTLTRLSLSLALSLVLPLSSARADDQETDDASKSKPETKKAADAPAVPVELDEPFDDPTKHLAPTQDPSAVPTDLDEPFVDPTQNLGQKAPSPVGTLQPVAGAAATPVDAAYQAPPEMDKLELRWGGRIQSDIRFRAQGKSAGTYYDRDKLTFYSRDDLPSGLARNENIFKLKLDAIYGRFAGVVDVDFVWLGYPGDIEGVGDLAMKSRVSPYYLQANAAYIEAVDFLLDGMDLRVGQQLVQWGKADQFNPTNNLNAVDLEDILLFGEQQANMMVRLDYNPWKSLVLSGVLVPIFQPALTPNTGPLALSALDRLPFLSSSLRQKIHAEQGLTDAQGYPTVANRVHPVMPKKSFENMQFSFRLAFTLLEQDLAFSFYRGFHDFPQATANDTYQMEQTFCDRDDPANCVNGLLLTDATLVYPRMDVIGFNMAGEIPLNWMVDSLGGNGYRLELGVYLPHKQRIGLYQHDVVIMGVTEDGEYDYNNDGQPGGPQPLVVDDTPFAKWTLGLDYSFGPHAMLVLMWVHGMANEFGAGDFLSDGWEVREGGTVGDGQEISNCVFQDRILGQQTCGAKYAREIMRPRIADYAVLGLDFKWAEDRALLRLFAIWEVSGYFEDRPIVAGEEARERKYLSLFGDGFSAIFYPEFNYNFGNGFEIGLGALLQFGKSYTRFGEPAAGGHLIWSRARFSF